MARETMGRNLDAGLVARVSQGLKYIITGVGPGNWFGPQQPLPPIAQAEVEGRAFDYRVAYNLQQQPRAEENVSFGQLRQLADSYDLMRLVIETRKDQIEAYEWELVPADSDVKPDSRKDDIRALTDFMESPNKEHLWPQWLRQVIEDLLVLDAVCVYPRASRAGTLYALELVAPDTIKRVIDENGRTPLPPSPAYQQVIHGVPAADYSRDSLIYSMRNPRTNRLYGYSPVEQVMTTVNIALRRQMSQLEYYTSGNVPEAIAQVPETWTAKQVGEFQLIWDSLNEGNTAARRKMRFVPSLKDIVFPKEAMLKDEFDEWLARIVCFAFSVSPSALIKQVNRASGEQMSETAKEEGLMPLLRYLEMLITGLVRRHPQGQGLKFKFKVAAKVAPKEQSEIDASDITAQIRTPDEVRADRGLEPLPDEERQKHWPTPAEPPTGKVDPHTGLPYTEPVPPAVMRDKPPAKAAKLDDDGQLSKVEIHEGDVFVTIQGDSATVRKTAPKVEA